MALTRPLTDPSGNDYPAAYWRAVQINISAIEATAYLVYYAWRDKAAFTAGLAPIRGVSKGYRIGGATFAALAASAPAGPTLFLALAAAADAHALATPDTPTGATDGEGRPVLISFFAEATAA